MSLLPPPPWIATKPPATELRTIPAALSFSSLFFIVMSSPRSSMRIFSSYSFFFLYYSYFFSNNYYRWRLFYILRSATCRSTFKIERSLTAFWYIEEIYSRLLSSNCTFDLKCLSSLLKLASRARYASLISSSCTSSARLRSIFYCKKPFISSKFLS